MDKEFVWESGDFEVRSDRTGLRGYDRWSRDNVSNGTSYSFGYNSVVGSFDVGDGWVVGGCVG